MDEQEVFQDPFFLSAVDGSDDCICALDLAGRVTFTNPRGQRALTLDSTRDPRGALWWELLPGEIAAEAAGAVAAALQTGERVDFRSLRTSSADGRMTCWKTTLSPVRDRKPREIAALVATSRNVTHEIDQTALLHAVIENVPAAICVKNAHDGRYGIVNKAFLEAAGRTAEEMIGRSAHDLL